MMLRQKQTDDIVSTSKSLDVTLFSVVFAAAMLVAGCNAVPNAGPPSYGFNGAQWEYVDVPTEEEGEATLPFVLVDVDRKIIHALKDTSDEAYFKGKFTDRSPPANVPLGVGDTVRITIFEAGPGGLFVPPGGGGYGGNFVTLPDQEIDQSGFITVPYADKDGDGGLIKISGRRPVEVQTDIQQRLSDRAIEPQVIVSLVKRTSNAYSVIGDVGAPGRYSLTHDGVRVLDALGTAGGPKNNDYNTLITLQRGGTIVTARLSTLLNEAENNVFVQPNDLISVKKEDRYYNVLGATKNNNRVAFESEHVTVADALAKAGGLDSELAEPAGVVVFRREDLGTLKSMKIKLDGATEDESVPTVYRFDLSEPKGMFLAQKMQLRDDDVVYVSSHPFSDFSKLLGAVRDILLIRLINK